MIPIKLKRFNEAPVIHNVKSAPVRLKGSAISYPEVLSHQVKGYRKEPAARQIAGRNISHGNTHAFDFFKFHAQFVHNLLMRFVPFPAVLECDGKRHLIDFLSSAPSSYRHKKSGDLRLAVQYRFKLQRFFKRLLNGSPRRGLGAD